MTVGYRPNGEVGEIFLNADRSNSMMDVLMSDAAIIASLALQWGVIGRDLVAEVKCRARGFSQLYDWLSARDLLIVRADRKEPLVILPLRLASEIAAKAAGHGEK